jgi:hypothetical protein
MPGPPYHACAHMQAACKASRPGQTYRNPIGRGQITSPHVHVPLFLPIDWPHPAGGLPLASMAGPPYHACAHMQAACKSSRPGQTYRNSIGRGQITSPHVHVPLFLPMDWPHPAGGLPLASMGGPPYHAYARIYMQAACKSSRPGQTYQNPIGRSHITPPHVDMPIWLPMHPPPMG